MVEPSLNYCLVVLTYLTQAAPAAASTPWYYVIAVPVGTLIGAIVAAGGLIYNEHRKARLERERYREQQLRDACADFASVCATVQIIAIEGSGLFDSLRDMVDLPSTGKKIDAAERVMTEVSKVQSSYGKLRLIAPMEITVSAAALVQAILNLSRSMTDVHRIRLASKLVGMAQEAFVNSVRNTHQLDPYSNDAVAQRVNENLERLKESVSESAA